MKSYIQYLIQATTLMSITPIHKIHYGGPCLMKSRSSSPFITLAELLKNSCDVSFMKPYKNLIPVSTLMSINNHIHIHSMNAQLS